MTLLATQPIKSFYAVAATAFELTCLPLWLLKHLTTYGRNHPSWTFRQSLSVHLLYNLLKHFASIHVTRPLSHTADAEKERFVLIKSQPSDKKSYFRGPLVDNPDVQPQDLGATWYPAPLSAASDLSNVLVILHIHGGAYVIGDGRTAATGFLAHNLVKHTPATHVLAPQYRLSTLPPSPTSNPFPAALQDTLTTYLYLLHEVKVPAANIIISGDSAGGNNTIAFLRYLAEYGADIDLPNPSAALLLSPWINPSDASPATVHKNRNFASDYLSHAFVAWGSAAYAGKNDIVHNKYVNMTMRSFSTKVPIWVSAGTVELLYDDDKEWARMMGEVEGNRVEFYGEEGAPHDVMLVGETLGFVESARRIAKSAGEFIKGVRV
jgi:acetyl esterase/lipase